MTDSELKQSALSLLQRLASKPGINSLLILSATTGSILQSSGRFSTASLSAPRSSSTTSTAAQPNGSDQALQPRQTDERAGAHTDSEQGLSTAEDIAKMVVAFVAQARVFAHGIGGTSKSEGESESRVASQDGGVGGGSSKSDGGQGEEARKGLGEGGEEVRLLRLRTRREEIVIYPEAKFLLVVVQGAPAS